MVTSPSALGTVSWGVSVEGRFLVNPSLTENGCSWLKNCCTKFHRVAVHRAAAALSAVAHSATNSF